MKLEDYKKRIIKLLSLVQTEIGNNNVIHYFDKNITAETFFAGLLNLVFDYQLQNLNNSQTYNHAFVDLCDKKNDIYIQVTSNKASQKIKDTIKGFETLNGITKKTKLIIFLLVDKPKYQTEFSTQKIIFDAKVNVINIKDIIKKIDSFSLNKLETIKNYLEANLNFIDNKEKTICSEEETIIKLIEVLSEKGAALKNIPSDIDPDFKINKRFNKFSEEIKRQYRDYYVTYGKEYLTVVSNLIKDEVTLININNYLKSTSVDVLKENNDNPIESLKKLRIRVNELLSSNNKKYSDGAIRFFLIRQIIECNIFPNEVKQNENR